RRARWWMGLVRARQKRRQHVASDAFSRTDDRSRTAGAGAFGDWIRRLWRIYSPARYLTRAPLHGVAPLALDGGTLRPGWDQPGALRSDAPVYCVCHPRA